ncbi:YDG domain-containing protein [Acinetobacter sp. LF10]
MGDQVNLNAQGQFADKNAGSNKNVNVSGNLTA